MTEWIIRKFDGIGYRQWRQCMMRILSKEGVLDHLEGDGDDKLLEGRAYQLLMGYIAPNIMKEVTVVGYSRDIWEELEQLYVRRARED
jgi:hypothetical protein